MRYCESVRNTTKQKTMYKQTYYFYNLKTKYNR